MVNFRRSQQPNGSYFFTLTLRDRKQTLLTDYIADLKNAMRAVQKTMPYRTKAIVVLPDHLHALWELVGAIKITLHVGDV